MAGLSPQTAFRAGTGLAVVIFLGLIVLPGCDGPGYPEETHYSIRTDPMVESTPGDRPKGIDPIGQLNLWIDTLDQKGVKLAHPSGIDPAWRSALGQVLTDMFGTPAKPKVGEIEAPQLDEATLAKGSLLYRRHCLHCHGLTGDGRGPTAPWVNPHPRDYRPGFFKFTSTSQDGGIRKARRADILRTLRQGVDGTSMPSFALLPEEELEALTSYVIHLSLRGKIELDTMTSMLDTAGRESLAKTLPGLSGNDLKEEIQLFAGDRLTGSLPKGVWAQWKEAEAKAIKVPEAPPYLSKPVNQLTPEEKKQLQEAIGRGYTEFLTGSATCVQCHNDFGRANDYLWDKWGTVVRPADLTAGVYRGGRRPLDLFYRMHSGVAPSGMPGFSDSLSDAKMWDIVAFIQALPYQGMLPEDGPKNIRQNIYGTR